MSERASRARRQDAEAPGAPRGPRTLGSALDGVVARAAPATPLAAVQTAWAGAVGERIAVAASPVAERDGVVTIACRSAVWAEQLDLLQNDLLERLRRELGGRVEIVGLRFSIAA